MAGLRVLSMAFMVWGKLGGLREFMTLWLNDIPGSRREVGALLARYLQGKASALHDVVSVSFYEKPVKAWKPEGSF